MMDKTAGKHDEQDDRMAGHNDLNPWNRNSSVDVLALNYLHSPPDTFI